LLARSFDAGPGAYARFRPGYPPAAVRAALPGDARDVLDLGAGTGKLTESLLGRGLQVTAVEPLPGMLAELSRRFPQATAVPGSAEDIPLPDGAVDCVVVGQAFHWFDPDRALAEIARVLRPGGTVSLLWNHDDESDPLVRDVQRELDRIGRPGGGASGRGRAGAAAEIGDPAPPFGGHPGFTEPALSMIGWSRQTDVEELIALLHTYSYVINASAGARSEMDGAVRRQVRSRYGEAGALSIPVLCEVWRATCR